MKLLTFHKLGENCGRPRLWLESQRLGQLGFVPGTPLTVTPGSETVTLTVASGIASNRVSFKTARQNTRPVIDINSRTALESIAAFEEVKILGSQNRLQIVPSVRAFSIRRAKAQKENLRVLELFAGGGTLSAAITSTPGLKLVAGCEIEPAYADVWAAAHPDAMLIQSDLRLVHPAELPEHDILVAGIPCTNHSLVGRAKHKLAGRPEEGEAGDLFVNVLAVMAHHLPLAVVLENVPSFGSSLAGQTVVNQLQKLGYHISTQVVEPHEEWNEPSNRRRWVLIGSLHGPIQIEAPQKPFAGTLGDYLDPADAELDSVDAERIAGTIAGLRRHNQRHQAQGHGFQFTIIDRESTSCPTITRSYHKISAGPFVATPWGPRLLRKSEIERIMGSRIDTQHYATAVEVLGQGVQTRIFKEILRQMVQQLRTPAAQVRGQSQQQDLF